MAIPLADVNVFSLHVLQCIGLGGDEQEFYYSYYNNTGLVPKRPLYLLIMIQRNYIRALYLEICVIVVYSSNSSICIVL